MTACLYEELGHTAEVGLRIRANSAPAVFACAAEGMFSLIAPPHDGGDKGLERQVVVEAADVETLMVDWLSELLYLHETTGELYHHSAITTWSPTRLEAMLRGCRPDESLTVHIKAVTYHQLVVIEEETGWRAEIYFDI